MRYLERDGTARDGEPGRFYSTFAGEADAKAFLERGADDWHQFRLIVSPEDGRAFEDLKGFTRDLMARMEQDLVDIHLRHDARATESFATAHVQRLEAIRRATGRIERGPDMTKTYETRHQQFLPEDMSRRLAHLAQISGKARSEILVEALDAWFTRRAASQCPKWQISAVFAIYRGAL